MGNRTPSKTVLDAAERIRRYDKLIQKQTGIAVKPLRFDGYVNLLNKYGTQKDTTENYQYETEPTIADEMLSSIYEGNGLFARIIDAPAEEAMKLGFELDGVKDAHLIEFYETALDDLDWEETGITAIKWARLFGGSIAVMLINDGQGVEMPLDWKNIKSIDGIRVYDRSVIQPDYSTMFTYSPEDPFRTRGNTLGVPEYYYINSKYGSFKVHESRCLIFKNGVLPENCTNSIYEMWGMPEYIRIKRAMRDCELAHGNGPKMLERAIQAVYKVKNLSELLQTDMGEDVVVKRLQTIDLARGLLNSIAIDAEGEEYDFRTFSFTGVSEIIDTTCNQLSALTSIPQTILFGRSPAGMNATGESDMENWYSFIARIQKRMLRRNLRYLLSIIFQAGVTTGEIDEVPPINPKFKPLWSLSELEEAQLEQTKAATQQTKAATAQIYVGMQAVDPTEVRKGLADSGEFNIETLLDDYSDEELFPPEEQQSTTESALSPEAAAEQNGISDEQNAGLEGGGGNGSADATAVIAEINDDGGAGSGNFGHEGIPGEVGGSLPSGGSFTDRMKEAYNYQAKGKDYSEVGREMRSVLNDMPVGSKVKVNGTEYEKTDDGQFKYKNGSKDVVTSMNAVANSVDPFDKKSMPEFEDPKSTDVAAAKVESGKLDPRETSVSTPQMKPAPYKGKQVVDVDAGQFQSLREELQHNTGKTFENKEVEECLAAIDEYRSSDYTDVVAASAGFGGSYADYAGTMSEDAKKAASAKAQKMEDFISSADKYEGKVMRAMGFDIGGDFDGGTTTEALNSLLNRCKPGSTLDMGHISSWTTDRHTIGQILGARTGNDDTAESSVEVVFTCPKSSKGVDIGRFSKSFTQGEVVFSKDQKFKVKSVKERRANEWTIRYDIEVEEA